MVNGKVAGHNFPEPIKLMLRIRKSISPPLIYLGFGFDFSIIILRHPFLSFISVSGKGYSELKAPHPGFLTPACCKA